MENEKYLSEQIITYLGNKRKLLDNIAAEVETALKELGIDKDKEVYIKAINNLSRDEIIEFCEDGEMPPSIANIIDVDPVSGNFVSKKYPDVKIGSIDDILDRYEYVNMMDDVEDSE